MQKDFILSHVDHTMLKQGATWADIQRICDEGLSHKTASVCIPPSYVADAAAYLKGQLAVCTVIGFPNGYQTTAVKVAETKDAIAHGADEIDMVINIGWVKDGKDQKVLEEINAVKEACQGRILKVIVETCLLTEEEKMLAESYARLHSISLAEAFKRALFGQIEDEYDITVANEAYGEYVRNGKKSRPISELWKELDL